MDLPVPDRVLSRPALLAAREQGQILIEPFDERYVKGCSVDVRLGDQFYEEQPPSNYGAASSTLNPWDPESVRAMWGLPQRAAPAEAARYVGIPEGTPIIVMPPKSVFLSHTMEFIGSLHPEITFMVKARSSTGRNRVRICACAGWGDQGYARRITLELANDSAYRSVILVPGRRIGQIVFIPTTPLPEDEMYFKGGKYQKESAAGKSYEQLCAEWNPEEMLPRQWSDWELQET